MSKSNKSHEYLFKASWRATAIQFRIEAQNLKQAQLKAEGKVFRMLGGMSCLDVSLVRQTR